MNKVDPITTQVIRNALKAAADEMMISLIKTAHNPLIYEVQDFGLALTNHRGEMLAEGSGLPGFMGCLGPTVRSGIRELGAEGFAEGDILLANEPYETGTHISDTAVYMPIFFEGRLVAFSALMAHWADIGGKTPGGWCPDTTDIHQEGLIFFHDKLVEAGELNHTFMRFILKNVRFPELVHGDLNAMIAACRTGTRRYIALCERYGADTIQRAMDQVFEQSEAMMRAKIREIPDGLYSASVNMDHDGVELGKPYRIAVEVKVQDDELHIDWTGTDGTVTGPTNHPFIGTVAMAETVLKSLTMPFDPMNHGHTRPLTVTAPDNTAVSPLYPAPTDSYGYVAEMVVHLIVRALSDAIPDRCPAASYQMFGCVFYRMDPRHGEPFIFIEPLDGGGGAFPHGDGPSGLVFVGNGNAPNTPTEVIEGRYPLRVLRHTFNLEGAGAGKYRGGFGVIREYLMLEDNILIQTMNENTIDKPWGLHGGGDAGVSKAIAWAGSKREEEITQRVYFFGPFNKGDIVTQISTGGGGWGDPAERDPSLIEYDRRNGYLQPGDSGAGASP